MGRPSSYSEEIAARFLAEVSTTKKGLRTICESDPEFPDPQTIYRWMGSNPDFRERYARAKEDQTQVLEDEMLEIADTTQLGEIVTIKPTGDERRIVDMIEHRKLQIETRKWLLGKLKPKKYGDRTVLAGDKDAPLGVQMIHSVPRPKRES